MDVRASVKVINEDHVRAKTAGVVVATDGKAPPKTVTVKFDTDQAEESMKVSDLQALGSN